MSKNENGGHQDNDSPEKRYAISNFSHPERIEDKNGPQHQKKLNDEMDRRQDFGTFFQKSRQQWSRFSSRVIHETPDGYLIYSGNRSIDGGYDKQSKNKNESDKKLGSS